MMLALKISLLVGSFLLDVLEFDIQSLMNMSYILFFLTI